MNAGELRHRVTIERETSVAGDYGHGGSAPTWEPVVTVWASVKPVSAHEAIRAAQPGQETGYIVKMRYTAEATADRRLTWEGRALYITGVKDIDGRHVELEILCNEREAVPSA